MKGFFRFTKNKWFLMAAGVLLGVLIVLGIRFATYQPEEHTHYHANFAVYINGQREEFKSPHYYEEVAICTAEHSNNPKTRTHMHENVNSVVHVHDEAVTWGQFFANLGWTLGPTNLITKDGTVYQENDQDKLNIIINGQDYTDLGGIANKVIDDKDRLLISYGNQEQTELEEEYKTVPATAAKYDVSADPASCGSHEDHGLKARLKHLF